MIYFRVLRTVQNYQFSSSKMLLDNVALLEMMIILTHCMPISLYWRYSVDSLLQTMDVICRGFEGYRGTAVLHFWTGGSVPLLFRTHERRLAVNRGDFRRLIYTKTDFTTFPNSCWLDVEQIDTLSHVILFTS